MSHKHWSTFVLALGLLSCMGLAGLAGEEGLAAQWNFKDAANPGADASGNNRNLTLTNGAKVVPDDKLGAALELDGNGARASIEFAKMPDLKGTSFTIAYWSDGPTQKGTALANGKGGHGGWYIPEACFMFEARNDNGFVPQIQIYADPHYKSQAGQWHHIAFVYDDKTKQVTSYCDGDVGQQKAVENGTDIGMPNDPWLLGARANGIEPFYKGKLADVRIFTKALSAEEVKALAAMPATAEKK